MKTFFKKTNDKKEGLKQETFSFKKMVQDGKIYILRFKNDLWGYSESGKYPYQIGIAVPLLTHQNGFPSKEENEQLLGMERILEDEFAHNNIAIFVGAIIGGGMKEFVFYT